MKTASVAALKAHLNDYLEQSQQGPVIVTRSGKPVAALVALADDDELERLMLSHSPKFRAIVEKSCRQIGQTGGIPHEQFWHEVESECAAAPCEQSIEKETQVQDAVTQFALVYQIASFLDG